METGSSLEDMVKGSVEDRQCRACSAGDRRRGHGRQKEGRLCRKKREGWWDLQNSHLVVHFLC